MIMIIIIIIMWDSQTRSKQLSHGSFGVPILSYAVLSYPILPVGGTCVESYKEGQ